MWTRKHLRKLFIFIAAILTFSFLCSLQDNNPFKKSSQNTMNIFKISWLFRSNLVSSIPDENQIVISRSNDDGSKSFLATSKEMFQQQKRLIFVVTPTYYRSEQLAELTRLAQTLALDGFIHWIIVEDSTIKSSRIENLLNRHANRLAGWTHLNKVTSDYDSAWVPKLIARGHHQRNEALAWLRQNRNLTSYQQDAVVYFADDDNTYDVRLFDRMRSLKKLGVWPVGLIGHSMYGGPVCDKAQTTVVAWRTVVFPERFCPCDMAGFAVSLPLILEKPKAKFQASREAMLETSFVSGLFGALPYSKPSDASIFEPIVCDEILVWHTRTTPSNIDNEAKLKNLYANNTLDV